MFSALKCRFPEWIRLSANRAENTTPTPACQHGSVSEPFAKRDISGNHCWIPALLRQGFEGQAFAGMTTLLCGLVHDTVLNSRSPSSPRKRGSRKSRIIPTLPTGRASLDSSFQSTPTYTWGEKRDCDSILFISCHCSIIPGSPGSDVQKVNFEQLRPDPPTPRWLRRASSQVFNFEGKWLLESFHDM